MWTVLPLSCNTVHPHQLLAYTLSVCAVCAWRRGLAAREVLGRQRFELTCVLHPHVSAAPPLASWQWRPPAAPSRPAQTASTCSALLVIHPRAPSGSAHAPAGQWAEGPALHQQAKRHIPARTAPSARAPASPWRKTGTQPQGRRCPALYCLSAGPSPVQPRRLWGLCGCGPSASVCQ